MIEYVKLIEMFERDTIHQAKDDRRRSAQGVARYVASHMTLQEVFDLLDILAESRRDRAEAWREAFGGAKTADSYVPISNTLNRDIERMMGVGRLDSLIGGKV